jgi:hypothetical protein
MSSRLLQRKMLVFPKRSIHVSSDQHRLLAHKTLRKKISRLLERSQEGSLPLSSLTRPSEVHVVSSVVVQSYLQLIVPLSLLLWLLGTQFATTHMIKDSPKKERYVGVRPGPVRGNNELNQCSMVFFADFTSVNDHGVYL